MRTTFKIVPDQAATMSAQPPSQLAADERPPARRTVQREVVAGLVQLADAIIIAAAGVATMGAHTPWSVAPLAALALAVLLGTRLLALAGIYAPTRLRHALGHVPAILAVVLGLGMATLAAIWLSQTDALTTGWIERWGLSAATAMVALRLLLHGLVYHWLRRGAWHEKIVIVGSEADVWRVAHGLSQDEPGDRAVTGVFVDAISQRMASLVAAHGAGQVEEAAEFCRNNPVDRVIIAMPAEPGERLKSWVAALTTLTCDVQLALNGDALYDGAAAPEPTLVDLSRRPLSGWSGVVKDAEDKVLGAAIMVLILPLMLTIGLAIRLDSPGPAVFRQRRMGYDNRPFTVLKFRTMTDGTGATDGAAQTQPGDARITRLGGFLRRSSLDELPQLWNVLRGEMSLVGPRPHPVVMLTENRLCEEIVPSYGRRHRVKPGITGWAQINGLRGATHTAEHLRQRVAHDLHYIENWSLWLDLKIVILTVLKGFTDRSAY